MGRWRELHTPADRGRQHPRARFSLGVESRKGALLLPRGSDTFPFPARSVGSRTGADCPAGSAYPLLPVSSGSASLAEP